ncbi:hypothetical protein HII36_13260 [Nonomuraea sp. NN258]|uniref:hypothetical protein n=1 Tax=Nonomuraea antri TaxID=2730852 RepID=UPI001567E98D|nr:hypothetical protein [Nonomuraea antri]NRQ32801.1 hypothetical protein [Nonomuraea antri]
MASNVFGMVAVIAVIVGVVLFLRLRRRPETRVGAYAGAGILFLAAGMLALGHFSFAGLESAMLSTFSAAERAAALPCEAAVLTAENTENKLNGRYVWWLKLRVTPRSGGAYEIERAARPARAMEDRLERGGVVLPCLVAPDDPARIEIAAIG